MSSLALRTADTHSRRAALTLALCLPSDVLLYLLLPMESQAFGITLAQAGVLLAANRLVRIFGYRHVLNFYARNGDRLTCMIAAGAATLCALGNSVLSGFAALLGLRLVWGLCFAALNLLERRDVEWLTASRESSVNFTPIYARLDAQDAVPSADGS